MFSANVIKSSLCSTICAEISVCLPSNSATSATLCIIVSWRCFCWIKDCVRCICEFIEFISVALPSNAACARRARCWIRRSFNFCNSLAPAVTLAEMSVPSTNWYAPLTASTAARSLTASPFAVLKLACTAVVIPVASSFTSLKSPPSAFNCCLRSFKFPARISILKSSFIVSLI